MLAKGKLHRLLKWLAGYQAWKKTAVSSGILRGSSAGHSAQQLALYNTPLLQLKDMDKASRHPGSGTTTKCTFSNPQQWTTDSTTRQGMSRPSS